MCVGAGYSPTVAPALHAIMGRMNPDAAQAAKARFYNTHGGMNFQQFMASRTARPAMQTAPPIGR